VLQQLRAKWRTWREHERQYKLERALSNSPRNEDGPHGGMYGTKQEPKGVDFQKLGGNGGA
jgi:hypothetical protein